MSGEPTAGLVALRASTADLLQDLSGNGWSDADARAASLCEGWTRAHVLTHLARNADGVTATLAGGLRGEVVPRYPGGNAARDRDIAHGAGRPITALVADVAESSERLDRVLGAVSEAAAWDAPTENARPAREWVPRRLREIEIHRVDLDSGYGPDRWPPYLVATLLPAVVDPLADRASDALRVVVTEGDSVVPELAGQEWRIGSREPIEVRGPDWALAAWATGRGALVGDRLSAAPSSRRGGDVGLNGTVATTETAQAPSLALFLSEPARTVYRLGGYPLTSRWLRRAPRPAPDDAHGVLVLPGLMTTDSSTALLRRFVRGLGHTVWGWRLGRNLGPTGPILEGMPRAIDALHERTGGPVSLIGWSLGGVFARELARRRPELVRQVITLGSPFALHDSRQSRVGFAYRRHSRDHRGTGPGVDTSRPIGVPSTAVYSKHDGIVHWRSCIEPESELHQNVEVRCAHLAYGTDLASLWVVADRLAQPRPAEHPFVVPPSLRRLYPSD